MNKLILLFVFALASTTIQAEDGFNMVFKTHGKFEDVRDWVKQSIEGRGLTVNHTNYIAKMLERTGSAVGDTRLVYTNGEQFEFCSAVISRKMMEADPHAIVMCPNIISIYTRPNESDTVYVAYRKLPPTHNKALNKALSEVNSLISGIIKDAIQ
jgi:uncharacterized protein (DUF302 family)